MKSIPFLFFISFFFYTSCKSQPSEGVQQTKKKTLAGLWISKTYTDSLKKSPTAKFNNTHRCAEIFFNDSLKTAWILDGEWEPKLFRYTYLGKHEYKILTGKKDSSFYFIYENGTLKQSRNFSGNEIKYNDYIFEFTHPDSNCTELRGAGMYKTALQKTFNKIVLEGTYKIVAGDENYISKKINFSFDGKLENFLPYNFYEVCISGDCKRYCDEMDLIYLSQTQNEPGGKWFCFEKKGDTLTIYNARSLEWMSNWPDIQPENMWLKLLKDK